MTGCLIKRCAHQQGILARVVAGSVPSLDADWIAKGLGGVLGQLDKNALEKRVACISGITKKHEGKRSPFVGSLLAVTWACKTTI